jgi:MFS family permease
MIPVSPVVMIIFVSLYAIGGALLGVLSGWITARILKSRHRLAVDSMLGATAFLLGGFIAIVIPWHTNTISYQLSGGTNVTSTMDSYQHPERVAVLAAIAIPGLHEILRNRRRVHG